MREIDRPCAPRQLARFGSVSPLVVLADGLGAALLWTGPAIRAATSHRPVPFDPRAVDQELVMTTRLTPAGADRVCSTCELIGCCCRAFDRSLPALVVRPQFEAARNIGGGARHRREQGMNLKRLDVRAAPRNDVAVSHFHALAAAPRHGHRQQSQRDPSHGARLPRARHEKLTPHPELSFPNC